MKLVINRCFGGFGLSAKALYEYVKRKYGSAYIYLDDRKNYNHYFLSDTGYNDIDSHSILVSTKDFGKDIDSRIINNNPDCFISRYRDCDRDDPILVEVVEELGEEASGTFANLSVVEIPDDIDWEIDDYDGVETIHEKHRTWC